MPRFEVYTRRSVGDRKSVVMARGIRRENGAINEREAMIQSTYDNAKKHADRQGDRVVVGPMNQPQEVGVVTIRQDGPVLVEVVGYRRSQL